MKTTAPAVQADRKLYALVVVSLLCNVAAVAFGILNALEIPELFHHSIRELSAKYSNEATPAGFVFAVIWPIIYLFVLAGSIYLFASIFIPANQSPVNHVPTLTTKTFLLSSSVGSLATVAWLFTFDRELLIPSFIILVIGLCALWQAAGTIMVSVYNNLEQLEIYSRTMLWMVRVLIHNGLCLFATWAAIATTLGFTIALIYVDSPGTDTAQLRGFVSQEYGSTIALIVVFVFIVAIFAIENFLYEPYFRCVFSIFPVFILALTGVVVQLSSEGGNRNLQIASVELGVSVVCFITRIVLTVFRFVKPPSSEYSPIKKSSKFIPGYVVIFLFL